MERGTAADRPMLSVLHTAPRTAPCALIADDQPDILAALGLLLKLEGVDCETAASPEAVIAAIERHLRPGGARHELRA